VTVPTRQRILIVEDEPIVALGIATSLGKLGYRVAGRVATGEQAVEAARDGGADLVLMDIRLAGRMDGVAAAEQIARVHGAPVIFLTAYADEKTLERAKAASPFGYVKKPFQDTDLHLAIEMALLRSSMEKKLNAAVEEADSQRGFFQALFEANPNGILVVDAAHRVHAANQVVERLLGRRPEQLSGTRIGELFRCANASASVRCGNTPGCGDCRLMSAVASALAGSQAYRHRTQLSLGAAGQGPRIDVLVSASGIEHRGERLAVVILEDVTELSALRRRSRQEDAFSGMVGRHPKMLEVFEAIRDVSRASAPVLVLGESGTGKELVARAIHDGSLRAGKPFVPVNCGALPESLLESELFGHVRGSFTGAIRDKKGRFELADGGTIFLDEIGDLTPLVQVKLLRVLQEGTFERVGGEKTLQVDVRVISATHKNLRQEVAAGRFRDDLYYRLCVVPITLPALRERGDDIRLLAAEFLKGYPGRSGAAGYSLGAEALRVFERHAWPGNVRELQNALQYAVIKARNPILEVRDLPPTLAASAGPARAGGPPPRLSQAAVERALRETGNNRAKAARQLGVSRATLYRFLGPSGGNR
jgi:DNA-binding NtrC family response regulator